MVSQLTNAATVTEDLVLAGLRRGLGRDGIPIPVHQTLGIEVRSAAAGPPSACRSAPRSAALGGKHEPQTGRVTEGVRRSDEALVLSCPSR
jgi:hypothetical protein